MTDLEWKVTYVGCAEDPSKDQVLEEVMVGPVLVGVNRFVLQAPAPNSAMIANEDWYFPLEFINSLRFLFGR